jgi:5-methylcytosine-specific restriction endonuclease McrA
MSHNNIQKNQSAQKAHGNLVKSLEELKKYERVVLLIFGEIMRRELYKELGFSSMLNYAREALKLSRTTAFYYISITKSLDTLPETKKAVEKGEIEWTKVREVTKVATPETEDQWLKIARGSTQKELAAKTSLARKQAINNSQPELISSAPLPEAEPKIGTSLSFSVEQMERFNALIEKMRKQGETGTREEILIKALTDSTSEKSTRVDSAPATQIVIRHCPECGKAETGAGEISQNDLEKAYCDAQVLENGRNKATIRPSVRREVMNRDNHTCQGQGCVSKRYLEVHHKVPRSAGGSNDASNLVTLCSACHKLAHSHHNSSLVYNKLRC